MIKKKSPTEYIGRAALMAEENELRHIVYDLSIENIDERQRKAIICDSVIEVATLLKVKTDVIFRNRVVGKKIKSLNGKFFAVRVLRK